MSIQSLPTCLALNQQNRRPVLHYRVVDLLAFLRPEVRGEFSHNVSRVEDIVSETLDERKNQGMLGRPSV